MKTSVLMSVYKKDNPEFLKLALESIYENQTLKPDEIVVVFDGELTNELYTVLDNFKLGKESIVFYYPQDKNRGLGEALRIGAEKCTGDYILRMDSDDIALPNRFEKQIAYIKNNPDVSVLGGNIAEFNFSIDENMRQRICYEKHEDIVKMSKRRNPMNHMTVCIKKSALLESGSYETMLLMEDYYLWLRMIAKGYKFANLNDVLVNVRIGNGFYNRRKSNVRIKSCYKLQKFMLKHRLINAFNAFSNMIIVIGATYCPGWVRKFVYERLLRKEAI